MKERPIMKYFIYEEGWGSHWYENEAEWKKGVDEFDFQLKFLHDVWNESVENCIAGKVPDEFKIDEEFDEYDQLEPYTLYVVEQFGREENPNDLDEDGNSKSTGDYWSPDWDYKCNYCFTPVLNTSPPPAVDGGEEGGKGMIKIPCKNCDELGYYFVYGEKEYCRCPIGHKLYKGTQRKKKK